MPEVITSPQNGKIKNILKLRKSRERKKQDLIVIEGFKEITHAILSGFELTDIFVCEHFAKNKKLDTKIAPTKTDKQVFEKISYRDTPDGFIALAKPKNLLLENIKLGKNSLLVILDSIEKPGNIGAIIRTADAVGADAIIINNLKTDLYNPNTIRASRGAIFSKQVVLSSIPDTVSFLKKNKITSFGAALPGSTEYTKVDFKKSSAIVIGTEDTGLCDEWLEKADKIIKIPMLGQMDSLNASVSAAVILFEALRQRD